MNSHTFSKDVLQRFFETVADLSAREIAGLSCECSRLALQNIAGANFDLAHFYFDLAKEFMQIAAYRKEELTEVESVG